MTQHGDIGEPFDFSKVVKLSQNKIQKMIDAQKRNKKDGEKIFMI